MAAVTSVVRSNQEWALEIICHTLARSERSSLSTFSQVIIPLTKHQLPLYLPPYSPRRGMLNPRSIH